MASRWHRHPWLADRVYLRERGRTIASVVEVEPRRWRWHTQGAEGECESCYAAQRAVRRALREVTHGA